MIFDPIVFPNAIIDCPFRLDKTEIKISGDDVPNPIIKKLDRKPDTLYRIDKPSVEVIRDCAPIHKKINPKRKYKISIDSLILKSYYFN